MKQLNKQEMIELMGLVKQYDAHIGALNDLGATMRPGLGDRVMDLCSDVTTSIAERVGELLEVDSEEALTMLEESTW
jgi:hypothetical protein